MLLVEPNDAPNLRSSCSGEDVVQPVGGLGRRGVPRLKVYGFHRSSGSDSGSPLGAGCSNARMGELMSEEAAGPPQYFAPEVSAHIFPGTRWAHRLRLGLQAAGGTVGVRLCSELPGQAWLAP